jgi:hypothetical protein
MRAVRLGSKTCNVGLRIVEKWPEWSRGLFHSPLGYPKGLTSKSLVQSLHSTTVALTHRLSSSLTFAHVGMKCVVAFKAVDISADSETLKGVSSSPERTVERLWLKFGN